MRCSGFVPIAIVVPAEGKDWVLELPKDIFEHTPTFAIDRTVRGGGFDSTAAEVRVTSRYAAPSDSSAVDRGVRPTYPLTR